MRLTIEKIGGCKKLRARNTYKQEDGGEQEAKSLVPLLVLFTVEVINTNDEAHVVDKEHPEIAGRGFVDDASAEWEEPAKDLSELHNRLINQERPETQQGDCNRLYCELEEVSQLLRQLILVFED